MENQDVVIRPFDAATDIDILSHMGSFIGDPFENAALHLKG
jgi:hypothetical protein